MRIMRASKAGFCMGVSLALKKLETAIKTHGRNGPRIRTLGPIIHNPQVLSHFAAQGVQCADCINEIGLDECVLIRAHGIPRAEEIELRARCAHVEDATCPKVKKAQLGIAAATAGKTLLLFGEADHPEVRGLISYAAGPAHVFASREELRGLPLDKSAAYALAAQTTQDKSVFEELASDLGKQLPNLHVLATICGATEERQSETIKIAAMADVMIVVGGKNSGNTRRLAALAAQHCRAAHHVESADELEEAWFANCQTAGLSAGASTPGDVIDAIEMRMARLG